MLIDEGHHPNSVKPKVTTYLKKRSAFYKIGYNPNHIPNQGNYPKIRAKNPKLEQWDNPKFDWPPKLPRATMHKGKTLLWHEESNMRKEIIKNRDFAIPNLRAGDVLSFTTIGSTSEAVEQTV